MTAWVWVLWTFHWCQSRKHLGFLVSVPRHGAEGEQEVGLNKQSVVKHRKWSRLLTTATLSEIPWRAASPTPPPMWGAPTGPPPPPTSAFGRSRLLGWESHSPTREQLFLWRWQALMSLQRLFELLNRTAYLRPCLSLSICSKNQSDAIMWSPCGMFGSSPFLAKIDSPFQTAIEKLNGERWNRGTWRRLQKEQKGICSAPPEGRLWQPVPLYCPIAGTISCVTERKAPWFWSQLTPILTLAQSLTSGNSFSYTLTFSVCTLGIINTYHNKVVITKKNTRISVSLSSVMFATRQQVLSRG